MPDLHAHASNITTNAHSQETFHTSLQFSLLRRDMSPVSLAHKSGSQAYVQIS